MERRKVYIRADADNKIGYGHFIRCVALADILKSKYDVILFSQNPSHFQYDECEGICRLESLPSDDTKFDIFLSKLHGSEIVVLGNYFFKSEYQKAIKNKGCSLVVLGSNDRHYYADAVINFTNLLASQFSKEPYTKMCLGLLWSILRKPFYKSAAIERKSNTFIICIGGTDQFCFAEKFSSIILSHYPQLSIKVISTDRIGEQRITQFHQRSISTGINLSADEMAMAFRSAEYVLVSASGVAIEALSQEANVISGYYVPNQQNIYNTLLVEDYIWPLGDFFQPQCTDQLLNAIHSIKDGQSKKQFIAHSTIDLYTKLFDTL